MIPSLIVCGAQVYCDEGCVKYSKGICTNVSTDEGCKTYCSDNFETVCDAKCVADDDNVLWCECDLPSDLCSQK